MPIITLLTDFGIEDEYVGIMKGVILSVNPSAVVVDITHHIAPQDIIQAAYTIKSSFMFFPKGTVHVVVVDPGVGTDRAILALEMSGHFFLAPDNGVLGLLIDDGTVDSITRVDNSDYFLKPVSTTFHGRDIFAPVAAHISEGIEIKKMGAQTEQQTIMRLRIPKPYISDKGELAGIVISIDRFGNLITNIDSNDLEKYCRNAGGKRVYIRIADINIAGISPNYEKAGFNNLLAIIGSRGYLEVSVNRGNAEHMLAVKKGDAVKVFPAAA